jgi:hypothetical protein
MVFGALQILIGVLCLAMVPFMLLGLALAARTGGPAMNVRMMLPSAMVYLIAGGGFIWLGLGSIRARRWGRALSLVVAWSWLVIGVFTLAFTAFLLPRSFAAGAAAAGGQPMPPGVQAMAVAVTLGILAVLFLILPGALVAFYQSRHVKATCEARDPAPRWTDACPLPVLAVCLWLWFGAATMLVMPLSGMSVLPLFGSLVSGFPAGVVFLALALGLAAVGYLILRLRLIGWWIMMVLMALSCASAAVTFARIDVMEFYRAMGYPQQQVDVLQQVGFAKETMMVLSLGVMLPWLLYLLFVRRYFKRVESPAASPPPPCQ